MNAGTRGTGGSTDCVRAPADQDRDVRFRSRDSTEHLPPTFSCLNIADANLEMPFAIVVAANEGRVRGDGDARDHGHLIDRRGRPKSLADFERVAPQRLRAHSSRHRQKMGQHLGGDTKRHQRRKIGSVPERASFGGFIPFGPKCARPGGSRSAW